MDAILTMLIVVGWFANDLHYQSRGPNFYGDHILADFQSSIQPKGN